MNGEYIIALYKLEKLSPALKPLINELFAITSKSNLKNFIDRYCEEVEWNMDLDLYELKEKVIQKFVKKHLKGE